MDFKNLKRIYERLETEGNFSKGMASIALKAARWVYPMNGYLTLDFESFVQELLVRLNKECGGKPKEPALMNCIARRRELDLLKYYKRRTHPSLNELLEDEHGNVIEKVELLEDARANFEEKIEVQIWVERNIPKKLQGIVEKRIKGIPLNDAERQRLSRFRKTSRYSYLKKCFKGFLKS